MTEQPDHLPLSFAMSEQDVQLSALYRREYAACGDQDAAARRVEEQMTRANILRAARAE
ncbi:hypothetical protein BjapCC829_21655 [Bradyrhizobium barranii]|uniref:Uncharacterized protein n=1 Tax=Bradyrhizobium barranii TaxID=2992140 RepID=A0ABY3QY79_9BRAD|nr:hypothetical protein [Bradyrhizobium japonicum]UFW91000.1 hypothetical protein BjapCC829_21655 [Bradyrhizobium japonicum]